MRRHASEVVPLESAGVCPREGTTGILESGPAYVCEEE